jgi:hypothetical protein
MCKSTVSIVNIYEDCLYFPCTSLNLGLYRAYSDRPVSIYVLFLKALFKLLSLTISFQVVS